MENKSVTVERGFKDLFSRQARDYAGCRPRYPSMLFEYLASLTRDHDLAWDCGTGNGQAATGLADHYALVVATDPSDEQIRNASPRGNVRYEVGAAERGPLAAHTCDIVTAAQCAHWFEHASFHAEVRRVAKPGAVVAVWCYGNGRETTPALQRMLRKYARIVRPFWEPEMSHVWRHYATLPFPFEELSAPPMQAEVEWSLEQLKGYLRSWSASQAYLRDTGVDPWLRIEAGVLRIWGDGGTRHRARWPIHVRLGRVS